MSEDNTQRWIWIGAALAGVAFLAVSAAGAWMLVSAEGAKVTGDLASAVESAGDNAEAETYEPTSAYIEEGLDPDVTTFGFGGKGGEPAAEPAGRELSEYELQNLVYEKQNSLMSCYADALADNPDLQGKVDMQFGIAPDGHVAMVKVTGSTLRSKTTEDCLVEQSRSWAFPATNRSTLMKFDTDFTFVYE